MARELEEVGDYEGARAALGELWRGVGERPSLTGLNEKAAALVLLRAGALSGFFGSVRQLGGSQEAAKDLIGESIRGFETLGEMARVIEAKNELALCYWREGAFDEARVILSDALERLRGDGAVVAGGAELESRLLLRSAMIECQTRRLERALELLTEAAPLMEACDNHILKGKFHGELALTLRHLGAADGGRADYMDRALVEYAASNFHFEQGGHLRYCARGENNLAMLFLTLGRYTEAHEHLERAREFFNGLRDEGSVAQVAETRARVYLAEGRNAEAERSARSAAATFERGGEQALLAEALTTHGVALARLGRAREARQALERAVEIAEAAGDREGGGRAALTIIEELGERLEVGEMCEVYERADRLLAATAHRETGARLLACARSVLSKVRPWLGGRETEAASPVALRKEESLDIENSYSLPEAVRRYEAELIGRALEANGGSITAAALQLGVPHQTLSAIIRRRHKRFLETRKPRKPRRVSIIRQRGGEGP